MAKIDKAKISEFDKEYFIQCRKEIDTEKQERDKLLHFAVLLLAGISIAILQMSNVADFVFSLNALFLEIPFLVIFTAMFWVRWKKLCQIADRWYTLYHILERYLGGQDSNRYLEQIVIRGFNEGRYKRKDLILNFCICSPIYSIMAVSCIISIREKDLGAGLIIAMIITIHIVLSFLIIARPMKDPYTA